MKLEQQVVSLELAKQLKELGVKQISALYWIHFYSIREKEWVDQVAFTEGEHPKDTKDGSFTYYSAFTVAELGEMLPEMIGWEKAYHPYTFKIENPKGVFNWWVVYKNLNDEEIKAVVSETEADARAKMLIWLIENKYL